METPSVNRGRAVDVIYLDVWKAFHTAPHNILLSERDRSIWWWTVLGKNWVNIHIQREVVKGSVPEDISDKCVPLRALLGQFYFVSSLMIQMRGLRTPLTSLQMTPS